MSRRIGRHGTVSFLSLSKGDDPKMWRRCHQCSPMLQQYCHSYSFWGGGSNMRERAGGNGLVQIKGRHAQSQAVDYPLSNHRIGQKASLKNSLLNPPVSFHDFRRKNKLRPPAEPLFWSERMSWHGQTLSSFDHGFVCVHIRTYKRVLSHSRCT